MDINMKDAVLIEHISKYDQIRNRLSKVNARYKTCSDKEIIEYLFDEIEQYRSKIKNKDRIIHNLSKLMQNDLTKDEELVAQYKADIYEYGSGRIEVCYICDVDKNIECDKRYCSSDCCTHTLDKRYAKNFAES